VVIKLAENWPHVNTCFYRQMPIFPIVGGIVGKIS